jgi:hypothetical protein
LKEDFGKKCLKVLNRTKFEFSPEMVELIGLVRSEDYHKKELFCDINASLETTSPPPSPSAL